MVVPQRETEETGVETNRDGGKEMGSGRDLCSLRVRACQVGSYTHDPGALGRGQPWRREGRHRGHGGVSGVL